MSTKEARVAASKRWTQKNMDKQIKYNTKSKAKRFFRTIATTKDVLEFVGLWNELNPTEQINVDEFI
jgi:hypothetical protein